MFTKYSLTITFNVSNANRNKPIYISVRVNYKFCVKHIRSSWTYILDMVIWNNLKKSQVRFRTKGPLDLPRGVKEQHKMAAPPPPSQVEHWLFRPCFCLPAPWWCRWESGWSITDLKEKHRLQGGESLLKRLHCIDLKPAPHPSPTPPDGSPINFFLWPLSSDAVSLP